MQPISKILKTWLILIYLALLGIAAPANAQQLGSWSDTFPSNSGTDDFDYPIIVTQDGVVSIVATVASTLISQFNSTRVLDQADETISSTILSVSPSTLNVPLAAGSYTVRIGRAHWNGYGDFTLTATLTPARPGATETETNDVIADASTHPDNLFAGAIGHKRTKDTLDWYDHYRFTLTADTDVHFDIQTASTLADFDTVLSLRNASNTQLNYTYMSHPSSTWDLHLAPGTYFLRLYIADWARYGGYTITTTTTPAVFPTSETENNDTIGSADPVVGMVLNGSVGYFRDKVGGIEDWDTYDYFSCQVTQGGTLSAEILLDDTLFHFNNVISIRDAQNGQLALAYLSESPRTVTKTNLNAGTYYIRISRATGYGGYQINLSGDITVHLGDVNADQQVTLNDVILALKATSGLNTNGTGLTSAADVNGDWKIGLAEAIVALQTLAGLR